MQLVADAQATLTAHAGSAVPEPGDCAAAAGRSALWLLELPWWCRRLAAGSQAALSSRLPDTHKLAQSAGTAGPASEALVPGAGRSVGQLQDLLQLASSGPVLGESDLGAGCLTSAALHSQGRAAGSEGAHGPTPGSCPWSPSGPC